jgi:hypothetical protein
MRPDQLQGDRSEIRTGQANYANATASGCGGNGGYQVS